MALNLDTTRQLRTAPELKGLVEAILSAPGGESEPDWLEWKREAELSDRRWHAAISKFIAGFANRDPSVAGRSLGGCGYLVLGVEPGGGSGVTVVDNVTLESGIGRFLDRQRARWSPLYVEAQGIQALIITIEPPGQGDPIVAIAKTFTDGPKTVVAEGDIWVRRHGQTARATPSEIDMLVKRAGATHRVSGLTVETKSVPPAVAVSVDDVEIERWLQRERDQHRRPHLPKELRRMAVLDLERRSPEEYDRAVENYLREAEQRLPALARRAVLNSAGQPLELLLANDSDENFASVEVELTFDGDVWIYEHPEDVDDGFPIPPPSWGTGALVGLDYTISPVIATAPGVPRGPVIDNSGSGRVVFDHIDVRPRAGYKLDPIYVVCDAKHAGGSVSARWSATSTSVGGVAEGEFDIPVGPTAVNGLSGGLANRRSTEG